MHKQNLRELAVACLTTVVIDCERLGKSRRRLKKGQEWSKFSKHWGTYRGLIMFLYSRQFALMTDLLDWDHRVVRKRLLRKIAGAVLRSQ